MAILINDNYSLQAENKAFDARYLDVNTPWASCAAAIAGIPTYRYPGLTININNEEWWWKDGIADGDLELKTLGGTSNLSGATNGLQLVCSDTYVALGGALTQDTTIYGGYGLGLGNIASGLTSISAVTPTFQIFDAGINSSLSFCHDQDTPRFDVCLYGENADSNADIVLDVDVSQGCFVASSAPNTTCCSALSLKTTDSNVAIYNAHSTNANMHYINEACIASSKLTCEALIDSGNAALNIKSVMDYDTRSFTFSKDNSTILSILSGGTARYGSNVTLSNDCDLAHKWYVDNATGALGGENGLTKDGDNIVLGGELTGHTVIDGGSMCLYMPNFLQYRVTGGSIALCATSAIVIRPDTSLTMYGGPSQILFANSTCKQLRDTDNSEGFVYVDNYCAVGSQNPRWIPDNAYVTGLTSTSGVQSANNGLTKVGDNVVLGGSLTGTTNINATGQQLILSGGTINICDAVFHACGSQAIFESSTVSAIGVDNGANCACIGISTGGFNIVDSFTNVGLKYLNNYCAAGKTNPRWIPDNAYVTGLTAGGVSSASNGLTLVGDDIKLGGTLTGNTDICLGGGAASQTFQIKNSGLTTCIVLDVNPTSLGICAANINSPFQTGRITAGVSGTIMCNGFANCYSCMNMSNSLVGIWLCGGSSNASFTVTDATSTPRGIEYAGNYNSSFSNCSLITKEYVTSVTSGITGAFTTASNGLCSSGQVVSLGGALTGDTNIDSGTYNFKICSTASGTKQISLTDGSSIIASYANVSGCTGRLQLTDASASLISQNSGCVAGISMQHASNTIYFNAAGNQKTCHTTTGFRYCGNYCATEKTNPRWIPDNQYVTGLTSQSITTGTNVGGGSEVFSGVTEQDAKYRTIVGSGDTSVTTVGDKIIVYGTSGGTGIYDGQSPSAIEVGGIPSGTVISGCTFTQLWEDLLVPELYQTSVGTPSTSAGATLTGLREIGCTFSQTITPSYSAGAITPLYCTDNGTTRGGAANNYNYSGPSVSAGWSGQSSCNIPSYVVTIGTQTWSVCTRYDEGACIKGSKGTVNPSYPTVCAQDSITPAGSTSIIGAYPLWATCDNITTPLEKYSPLCNMGTANNVVIELCSETVTDKQKFAIPCAWLGAPTNRPLNGVSWWNNLAGSWVDETSNWSGAPSTETVQGNSVGYCEYTYGGSQRGGICIRLEF